MNFKIFLGGFIVAFILLQVIECKEGMVMKISKAIGQKVTRYTKPFLVGTERSAGKLTRDVGIAGKFTARKAINGLIVTNLRFASLLRFAKKKYFKKKGGDTPAPAESAPPPPAPSKPEPTAAAAPAAAAEPASEPAADGVHDTTAESMRK